MRHGKGSRVEKLPRRPAAELGKSYLPGSLVWCLAFGLVDRVFRIRLEALYPL